MKSSTPMENVATNSRHGVVIDMENLSTSSPAPTAAATTKPIASGDVEEKTAAMSGETILGHSLLVSADEERRLYRIQKDRANGFMVSVTDVDFLLDVIERHSR